MVKKEKWDVRRGGNADLQDKKEKQMEDFKESLQIFKASTKTIISYVMHVKYFFAWMDQEDITDLREVTSDIIKAYQSFIMKQNYSLNTVHIKLRSIKKFFEYLESIGELLYNPCENMKYPHLGKRLPENILTIIEMKMLLDMPNTGTRSGLRDKTILELLYTTGIRREECSRLTVHDVDHKEGFMRINKGKGAKDRVLPLGKKACLTLREYLLHVRPYYSKKNSDERALFMSQTGKAFDVQSVGWMVKKYGRAAGIKKPVTPHAIRRAFATHMLKNNAHPLYIQRLLGHSTGETLKKYIKVTITDIKDTHKRTHPRERDRR